MESFRDFAKSHGPTTRTEASYSKLEKQEADEAELDALSSPSSWGSWKIILTALVSFFLILLGILTTVGFAAEKGPVPEFSMTARVINPETHEMSPEEISHMWETTLPGKFGFFEISNPDQFRLKPGMRSLDGNPTVYGMTWTHQFHCLDMLRISFNSLRFNDTDGEELDYTHIHHCFDYLRQLIICHGDTTVEPAAVKTDPSEKDHIDGWGITHQCKDKEQLFSFLNGNLPRLPKNQKAHDHGSGKHEHS